MKILRFWKTVDLKTAPFHATYDIVPRIEVREDMGMFDHIVAAIKASDMDYEIVEVTTEPVEKRGEAHHSA